MWCIGGLLAIAAFVLLDHFGYHANLDGHFAVRRIFNLGREDSFAAAFGISLTFIAAVIAWAGWLISRHASNEIGWLGCAVLLTVMGIDDTAHVHERIGTWLASRGDPESLLVWFPSYGWQVLIAPMYGVLAIAGAVFLHRRVSHAWLRWAPPAGVTCWVAAVAFDFVEGLDAHTAGHPYVAIARAFDLQSFSVAAFREQPFDMLMHYGRVAEESIETVGVVLFGSAVIWLVAHMLGETEFRLAGGEDKVGAR